MAKSKLEKAKERLDAAIEAATAALAEMEDDRAGEVSSSYIAAKSISESPDSTLEQIEDAAKSLEEALSPGQNEPEIPTTRLVSFKGTASQLIGSHTLHYGTGVINFVEGKALLPIELAEELEKAGYIE